MWRKWNGKKKIRLQVCFGLQCHGCIFFPNDFCFLPSCFVRSAEGSASWQPASGVCEMCSSQCLSMWSEIQLKLFRGRRRRRFMTMEVTLLFFSSIAQWYHSTPPNVIEFDRLPAVNADTSLAKANTLSLSCWKVRCVLQSTDLFVSNLIEL